MTENMNQNLEQNNNNTNTDMVEKSKPKKTTNVIKVSEKPNRHLPKLIQSVLDKNFLVVMNSSGYYIEGFYGLKHSDAPIGYIFCQETTEEGTMLFLDAKGHKHYVKSFEELASLNSIVWGQFFKQSDEYKKPNAKWFGFMLELGVLNITPNK